MFARYVMFSEVYWHHAVRSATAMFQRAFFLLSDQLENADLSTLFRCKENEIVGVMQVLDRERKARSLLDGLFGSTRKLYKRWAQFNFTENKDLHSRIAGKPYAELAELSAKVADSISQRVGEPIHPDELLVDAPPMGLEVQFDVDVFNHKENTSTKLGNVSPVVETLASSQFDNFVKQVRLFVHPRIASKVSELPPIDVLSESLN